jgi:hypothetical protein
LEDFHAWADPDDEQQLLDEASAALASSVPFPVESIDLTYIQNANPTAVPSSDPTTAAMTHSQNQVWSTSCPD